MAQPTPMLKLVDLDIDSVYTSENLNVCIYKNDQFYLFGTNRVYDTSSLSFIDHELLVVMDNQGNISEYYMFDSTNVRCIGLEMTFINDSIVLMGSLRATTNNKWVDLKLFNVTSGTIVQQWDFSINGYDKTGIMDLHYLEDSTFYLTGWMQNNGQFSDAYCAKMKLNQQIVWEYKTNRGPLLDNLNDLSISKNNEIILTGYTGNNTNGDWDIYILAIDDTGKLIWDTVYGGEKIDVGNFIIPFRNSMFIGGSREILNDTNTFSKHFEGTLAEIDLTGNQIWTNDFTYRNNDDNIRQYFSVGILTSDSNILVAGILNDSNYNDRRGIWIVLFDPLNKSKLWERYYKITQVENDDYVTDITQTGDHFILTGYSIEGIDAQDGWILVLDSLGCYEPNCDSADVVNEIEIHPDNILIYPNPSSGRLVIQSHLIYEFYTLYNLLGQNIHAGLLTDNFIDLQTIEPGMYILQLTTRDGHELQAEKVVLY